MINKCYRYAFVALLYKFRHVNHIYGLFKKVENGEQDFFN